MPPVLVAAGATGALGAVAGAIHPQLLLMKLVDCEAVPAAFSKRIREWRSESATFRINVALSKLPRFNCLKSGAVSRHYGSGILISPSLHYLDEAHTEALATGYSRRPVIELMFPSTLDDSLAPSGAHVASLFCQHFPRHPPDGRSWGEVKPEAVERILATVSDYLPEFRRSIVGLQALSPEDLEQRFALIGGDIFHGQMTLDQLYWARPARGYAQYRTPVAGVYLCASGAHPGGGVTGAPGYNAARTMLADLEGRSRPFGREPLSTPP